MESFFKDLLSTYTERLKNTFFSSFVLAWIGWNWKYFYITLFVSEKALDGHANKFAYMLSIDTNGWILLGLPLATAILYIMLLTPINRGVNSFVEFFKLKAKNTKINIWEKEKFSKKEVDEFREIDKRELKEKDDKIAEFEKRLAKKDKEFVDLSAKHKELSDDYEGMYTTYVLPQETIKKITVSEKKKLNKTAIEEEDNIDVRSYSNEEKARFLKFKKLSKSFAFLASNHIENMLKDNEPFDYENFDLYNEVGDFFQENDFVEFFENKDFAKLTKKFHSFYKSYLKYIGEGI